MAWEIALPNGDKVRTDELLVDHVIDYAKRHETSWSVVIDAPIAGDGTLMKDMYRSQCERHGCKPEPVMTMDALQSKFTLLEEPDEVTEEGDPDADPPPAKS